MKTAAQYIRDDIKSLREEGTDFGIEKEDEYTPDRWLALIENARKVARRAIVDAQQATTGDEERAARAGEVAFFELVRLGALTTMSLEASIRAAAAESE